MNNNNNQNTLTTKANLSELQRIRDFVIDKAKNFGFSDEVSSKIALAVDEACSNLIKHSFNNNDSDTITLKIESLKDSFKVIILDNGNPFDPQSIPSPDMNEYFKSFKKGGLGIHIMKSVMDEVNYIPSSNDNSNKLILIKYYN